MSENDPLPPTPSRPSPEPAELSLRQRLGLVRALQQQALQRPDALGANLGVISADLMGFVHQLAASAQAALFASPAAGQEPGSTEHLEVYLKLLRHMDRLVKLDRQSSPASRGAPGYR